MISPVGVALQPSCQSKAFSQNRPGAHIACVLGPIKRRDGYLSCVGYLRRRGAPRTLGSSKSAMCNNPSRRQRSFHGRSSGHRWPRQHCLSPAVAHRTWTLFSCIWLSFKQKGGNLPHFLRIFNRKTQQHSQNYREEPLQYPGCQCSSPQRMPS